jgi:hypothetical protein
VTDDDLVALEREGWAALGTSRGAEHSRRQLTDDALMAFPFGVLDREQALEAMAGSPPWSQYELSDLRVLRLGSKRRWSSTPSRRSARVSRPSPRW